MRTSNRPWQNSQISNPLFGNSNLTYLLPNVHDNGYHCTYQKHFQVHFIIVLVCGLIIGPYPFGKLSYTRILQGWEYFMPHLYLLLKRRLTLWFKFRILSKIFYRIVMFIHLVRSFYKKFATPHWHLRR